MGSVEAATLGDQLGRSPRRRPTPFSGDLRGADAPWGSDAFISERRPQGSPSAQGPCPGWLSLTRRTSSGSEPRLPAMPALQGTLPVGALSFETIPAARFSRKCRNPLKCRRSSAVEQLICNQQALGSSPSVGTTENQGDIWSPNMCFPPSGLQMDCIGVRTSWRRHSGVPIRVLALFASISYCSEIRAVNAFVRGQRS